MQSLINETPVAEELDCSGMLCPMPIYQTSRVLKKLQAGDILRIICTDPGSLRDFPALANQAGHELVGSEEHDGVQVFFLRKGGTP
jgi:tRNA 2-thiouridine synthesizing protein A